MEDAVHVIGYLHQKTERKNKDESERMKEEKKGRKEEEERKKFLWTF